MRADTISEVLKDLSVAALAIILGWCACVLTVPAKDLMVNSAVTVKQVGVAVEHVDKLVVAVSPSVQETSKHVAGITGDVHSMTTKAAAPETFGQKVKGWLKIGALVVSKFL